MDLDLYIEKSKLFYRFMVSQKQWSGLEIEDIDKWINNFRELDIEEQYLAYKLLAHLIYFSEKDIIEALKNGLYKCLLYKEALEKQIENDFQLSPKAIDNIFQDQKDKSVFIPLLDSDSPHESGNYILRLLVQQGMIKKTNSMYLSKVPIFCKKTKIEKIIIVDDCVGSGQQLRTFCNKHQSYLEGKSIKEFCLDNNIELHYLVLFGYEKSIKELESELDYLNICCVRFLTERQRVFSKCSYVWGDVEERERAYYLFEHISNEVGIPFLGYNDLDFAFVMHNTIPDWSLPFFWKENSEWNLLIRRKNSNE